MLTEDVITIDNDTVISDNSNEGFGVSLSSTEFNSPFFTVL